MARRTKPGAEPGSVVVDPAAPQPVITVIAYDAERYVEQQCPSVDSLDGYVGKYAVTWVNIDGLGDAKTLETIGRLFDIHRLALEDVVNVHQRAKVEHYPENLFIVARMVMLSDRLQSEQVSMFLGANYVLTFQEHIPGDSFEPVRERLRKSRGRIRALKADYLAYALLDAVIDGYFPVLEQYGERVEDLEEEVLNPRDGETLNHVHEVKHDLLLLRRSIWPQREAVQALYRDPTPLVSDETRLHLRDCYDHTVQLIDLLETYRELGSDLRDLYLSSLSNRMNEIMKVLTVISTIFIPLNFIAGVYGMNFDAGASPFNMPELKWYLGYPFALSIMAIVALALVWLFYRNGWLGKRRRPRDGDDRSTASQLEKGNG